MNKIPCVWLMSLNIAPSPHPQHLHWLRTPKDCWNTSPSSKIFLEVSSSWFQKVLEVRSACLPYLFSLWRNENRDVRAMLLFGHYFAASCDISHVHGSVVGCLATGWSKKQGSPTGRAHLQMQTLNSDELTSRVQITSPNTEWVD